MSDGNTIVNINYSISPYDLAVAEGFFDGTLTEWFESLRGAPGEDGEDGTGGATVTVSNGATIVHDGSGTELPTFSNGGGTGTLVSNGNVIQSVSGEFETSGSGAYVLNHDLNPPGQEAVVNVLGEAYFAATGAPPITGRQNLQDVSSHTWGGLVSSELHRFAWKF